jgi:K+-sensing histidine kinase KdpD
MPKHPRWFDPSIRFVGAALFVALSAGLARLTFEVAPFQSFIPGIVLSCLVFGFGPGVATVLMSALVLWYYFVPPFGFSLPDFTHAAQLFFFLCITLFLCRIIAWQRRANEVLAQENFELGYKNFLLRGVSANGKRRAAARDS